MQGLGHGEDYVNYVPNFMNAAFVEDLRTKLPPWMRPLIEMPSVWEDGLKRLTRTVLLQVAYGGYVAPSGGLEDGIELSPMNRYNVGKGLLETGTPWLLQDGDVITGGGL